MAESITELVNRWRVGDESAATQLFVQYQKRLLEFVASHLSEKLKPRLDPDDLVQSILKSAFRVARKGDVVFSDETGFWKWLVTVALNKTYKRIDRELAAKRDRRREASGQLDHDTFVTDRLRQMPTSDEVVEVADLLENILLRLNQRQRQVLLWKLDGFHYREMAARLGVSEKTIQREFEVIRAIAAEMTTDPDQHAP